MDAPTPIPVLDAGYVRLVGVMRHFGTEEDEVQVVNAARSSYEKEVTALGKRDVGLINFLIRRSESSPFRHSVLAYEVRAPLMIARQWWRYQVGSAHLIEADAQMWSEGSRRYVTEEPEFYVPARDQWRSAPANKKQGSGDVLSDAIGAYWKTMLAEYVEKGTILYAEALADDVCAEQARLFLPAYGLYVRWRWTASLLAVLHFLDERLPEDAQGEMRRFAEAVYGLSVGLFPHSFAMIERQEEPSNG